MPYLSEFNIVRDTIKIVLKKRKITYVMLAEELGLSESGVKKILSSKDCSFGRLSQICQVLGLSILDILKESEKQEVKDESFSMEVEEFFVNNFSYFQFYWQLVAERKSVNEIKEINNFSEDDLIKYLDKLDELGIIEFKDLENIKLPKFVLRKWVGQGPLTYKVQTEWSEKLIRDVVKLEDNSILGNKFVLRHLKLKESSIKDLIQAIEEVEYEFINRSRREQSLGQEGLRLVRLLCSSARGSFASKID